jgi:O-antigen/teichoic acid export membrane protein
MISGFVVLGALGGYLVSSIAGTMFLFPGLKRYMKEKPSPGVDYRSMLWYMFPVALCSFCFVQLSSFDIVLVKYFFDQEQAGIYSLAQMVGKIFLFLPMAISMVMFSRTSRQSALNQDSTGTFWRSFSYVAGLCTIAAFVYNVFPEVVLKVLTGKVYPEAVHLGRFFSLSMSLFALINLFTAYFLSVRDFRFLWSLVAAMLLQIAAIYLYHPGIQAVQVILCVSSAALLLIQVLLFLTAKKP